METVTRDTFKLFNDRCLAEREAKRQEWIALAETLNASESPEDKKKAQYWARRAMSLSTKRRDLW